MSEIVNIKTRNMEYQSHRRYPENWVGEGGRLRKEDIDGRR